MGWLISDAVGEGAKKKMAKRRVEFISGNVNSYARVMNSQEHLDKATEANGLAAILGEMKADGEEERATRAAEKKTEDAEREKRREAAAQKEQEKRTMLLPSLLVTAEELATRAKIIDAVNIGDLKDLLKYFFEPPLAGLSKMKRAELVAAVEQRVEVYRAGRFEA
jgi:hypothetical protein